MAEIYQIQLEYERKRQENNQKRFWQIVDALVQEFGSEIIFKWVEFKLHQKEEGDESD